MIKFSFAIYVLLVQLISIRILLKSDNILDYYLFDIYKIFLFI